MDSISTYRAIGTGKTHEKARGGEKDKRKTKECAEVFAELPATPKDFRGTISL